MCGWIDRCRDGNLRTYCHVSPILFVVFFVETIPTCFCIFVNRVLVVALDQELIILSNAHTKCKGFAHPQNMTIARTHLETPPGGDACAGNLWTLHNFIFLSFVILMDCANTGHTKARVRQSYVG